MAKRTIYWLGSIAIILVVLSSCEFMAFLVSSYLRHHNLIFCSLQITESYEEYQRWLLPNLGWRYSKSEKLRNKFYDITGSRRIPAFPDPYRTPPRLSLYGDSYTEAWGVDNDHAWSNVLSQLLNCRVSNFGIAGYGTDQAYLRFLENTQDPAEVVVLGIFPENIKRNVNQLRNLISNVNTCLTKPRFILNNEGHLILLPIPSLTKSAYYEMQYNPGRFFHHEFFLPGGPSGRQMATFPYLWGMAKALHFMFKNLGMGDSYPDFYQPGHPSRGLEVMTAIIEEFCHTAQTRGKRPVIMIIPTYYDLLTYQRHEKWIYQPLLYRLTEVHVEYIDAGPKLLHTLGGADPRTIYSPKLSYHLTEEGNRILAHILYEFLAAQNLLKRKN